MTTTSLLPTAGTDWSDHFHIRSLGLGYYEAGTRADVYGEFVPIHPPKCPMGTTYGDAREVARRAILSGNFTPHRKA